MANPFMAAMGGTNGQQNGLMAMIHAFNQFKQSFQGDPKSEVEKLLSSGSINQNQLNQLQATAKQLMQVLGQ